MTKMPRSPESVAIERLLLTLTPGQALPFTAMSAFLQFDIEKFLGHLYRVRDALKRHGVSVIEITDKVGVYRLTDTQVLHQYAPGQQKRVRKTGGRAVGGVSSVNYAALAQCDQTKHNVLLAQFGAVMLFSAPRRSEKKIAESPRPVHGDVQATLALFVKPKKK